MYGMQRRMFLRGVKAFGILETENLLGKEEFKTSNQNRAKTKWHEKRMYGQFGREMNHRNR